MHYGDKLQEDAGGEESVRKRYAAVAAHREKKRRKKQFVRERDIRIRGKIDTSY
jgi:hypothetical protein